MHMRSYTTLAGAERAGNGPIVRILHDPAHLFVPVLSLKVELHVLTRDRPGARPISVARMTLMDMVDIELARQQRLTVDVLGVEAAAAEMVSDYQTGGEHHPAYVLVPTGAFERMRAALGRS